MNQTIQRFLLRVSRFDKVQSLLQRTVSLSQSLMGIGAGTDVESSGEASVCRRILRETSAREPLVILDVGANQGQFLSLVLNELEGRPLHVHAFEPGATTFALLKQKVGERPDVTLNPFGLAREAGTATLHYGEAGSGLASLTQRRLDHFGLPFDRTETVRLETLDAYCANAGIQSVDWLKLDVEGHELEVLRGATRMLREKRIRRITFEFGGCNIDTRTFFQDFWYFFQEQGMTHIYRITPAGHFTPVRQYAEIHEQFRTTNFLVLP